MNSLPEIRLPNKKRPAKGPVLCAGGFFWGGLAVFQVLCFCVSKQVYIQRYAPNYLPSPNKNTTQQVLRSDILC